MDTSKDKNVPTPTKDYGRVGQEVDNMHRWAEMVDNGTAPEFHISTAPNLLKNKILAN